MTQLANRIVRGYELRESLGAGGFGAVFRAYQPVVGREVAVKIILPQYANQPDFVRRFEAEAQLVARLEHIHIVPLYDYWRDPGGAYLVMRWLQGGSLRAKVRNGPLPLFEIARLLDQIASALASAHRHGVIHRDLKPDNILLDDDGNAYLADFGIAKELGKKADTEDGEGISGSPAYLSPEQITGDMPTPQTDIYSLGVTLYELLIGETPWPRLSAVDLIAKHLHEPLPSLLLRRPDLPTRLDAVIQKATAKSPDQRYSNAPSLAVAFRQAIGVSPAVPPGAVEAASGAQVQTRRGGTAVNDNQTDLNAPTIVPGTLSAIEDIDGATITPKSPGKATNREVPTGELENPYKGLRAFQQADEADFFGRGALIQQLVLRVGQDAELTRFLAVIGPSGSGKSSVVRAGLLPALRKGALPGSQRWFLVEMIPGARPLQQLEEALLRVAVNPVENLRDQLRQDERGLLHAVNQMLPDEGGELVLVIDQFEEVFTLWDDEAERAYFLDSLRAAITDPASRLRVIVTLRADFYDRPLLYPDFGNLIRQRTEVVLPLANNELREAIIGPANRVGVHMEPGLVEAIISDVGEQPGALPLLQYALTELFEHRKGHVLTLEAYHASGGVIGALARRADEIYNELDITGREIARQMFLRLVTIGEGAGDTRRRVYVTDLTPVNQDRSKMDGVLDAFSKSRLLTFDRDSATRAPTVEIAHEALIRTWDRLNDWLAESREELLVQRRLDMALGDWIASGREASFLASGTRLDQFDQWANKTTLALNEDERVYLDASIAERRVRQAAEEARKAHEAMLERRSRNRLRVLVLVLLVATVGALGLTGLAVNQQEIAVANAVTATIAQGQALNNAFTAVANANTATVAQGQALNNAVTATLAQGQAVNNARTAISNAYTATVAQGQAIANAATAQSNFVRAESQRLAAEAVNVMNTGDANVDLAGLLSIQAMKMTYSPQADAALLRATTLDYALRSFPYGQTMYSLSFSPDGRIVMTGGEKKFLRLWDTSNGKLLRELKPPEGDSTTIWSAVFSPDGKQILTSSESNKLLLWDVQTGTQIRTLPGEIQQSVVAFSPDGRFALFSGADNTVVVWDLQVGRQSVRLSGHTDEIRALAFSPDGKSVLTGSTDKTARVWDMETGKQQLEVSDPSAGLLAVGASPDGKYLATSGSALIFWDMATGNQVHVFGGAAQSIAFTPDSKYLLANTGLAGGQVWDLSTWKVVRNLTGHTLAVNIVALSADGRWALTGSWDGTARLWDMQHSIGQARQLLGHTANVTAIAYSPDGKYILTGSTDTTARLWNAQTGELVQILKGHTDVVWAVHFSPDGRLALTGSADKTARLWDLSTGQQIRQFEGHTDELRGAAFSPDGKLIVSGGNDLTVRLWDVETGTQVRQLAHYNEEVLDVTFSPDGKTILVGNLDGHVYLLDTASGKPIKDITVSTAHLNAVFGVAFSPDGKSILAGNLDKIARTFDLATGKLTQEFVGHSDYIIRVAYSPNGKYILTASVDGTARLWDAMTGKELRRYTHSVQVTAVSFSPDGKMVLTGSRDQSARLWDVDYHDTISYLCSHLLRDLTQAERSQYGITNPNPVCDAN